MRALSHHPLPPRAAFTDEPIFRLSVEQYHALIRSGELGEDDPVELVEGILTFKMPKNDPHVISTKLAVQEIGGRLPQGWHYQSQEPITLADGEPEPDGAVIRGTVRDFERGKPTGADTALVIEVADTSLMKDRGIKLRSYARAGIPVYWIINVVDRQVEVHADPFTPMDGDPTYRQSHIYRIGDTIPLVLSNLEPMRVTAESILPTP